MSFESYKVAATSQLTAWSQTIHEKAANVSEGTLKNAKGAIGAVAIVSLVKAAYDSYNGDFSYLWNVAPVAAMFIMKTGVDYVQAVKVAANANNFAILKSKVQSAIVNQAKELRPDWADKTDKANNCFGTTK